MRQSFIYDIMTDTICRNCTPANHSSNANGCFDVSIYGHYSIFSYYCCAFFSSFPHFHLYLSALHETFACALYSWSHNPTLNCDLKKNCCKFAIVGSCKNNNKKLHVRSCDYSRGKYPTSFSSPLLEFWLVAN